MKDLVKHSHTLINKRTSKQTKIIKMNHKCSIRINIEEKLMAIDLIHQHEATRSSKTGLCYFVNAIDGFQNQFLSCTRLSSIIITPSRGRFEGNKLEHGKYDFTTDTI